MAQATIVFNAVGNGTARHVMSTVTIGGVRTFPLNFDRYDLATETNVAEAKENMLAIMRHEIKKNGWTTPAEIKAGLESTIFYL